MPDKHILTDKEEWPRKQYRGAGDKGGGMSHLPKIEKGKIYTDGKGNYREVMEVSDPGQYFNDTPQEKVAYRHTVKGRPRVDICCMSSFRKFARKEWKEKK